MIAAELKAQIRHWFHAEHWKVGTIATQLGLHPDTVRRALETERFRRGPSDRTRLTDPYLDFLRQTLQQYPRLRATRLFQMLQARGYPGSVVQLRRVVAQLRPHQREAFLCLQVFPGEQAQADWASFGEVQMGQARRRLSAFVVNLSHSRALWLEFFCDQSLESFLLGHVHAFHHWGGAPRVLLVDNLRSVVLERYGHNVRFHPRWLELVSVAKLGGLQENSPPQLRRGCGAQRHGGGVIAGIPLLARSLPSVRTTPAAACGRGFPLSKEGNFSAEFRDRN